MEEVVEGLRAEVGELRREEVNVRLVELVKRVTRRLAEEKQKNRVLEGGEGRKCKSASSSEGAGGGGGICMIREV